MEISPHHFFTNRKKLYNTPAPYFCHLHFRDQSVSMTPFKLNNFQICFKTNAFMPLTLIILQGHEIVVDVFVS